MNPLSTWELIVFGHMAGIGYSITQAGFSPEDPALDPLIDDFLREIDPIVERIARDPRVYHHYGELTVIKNRFITRAINHLNGGVDR